MKVLVIKTSSLGDVIHTLPALTDAAINIPGISFDWIVEESFSEIPAWHRQVDRLFLANLRSWRKKPYQTLRSDEWKSFYRAVREQSYDLIIDAQGLTKSALIARLAKGPRHGLDRKSARDPFAFIHYNQAHSIAWGQHAVERVRELFSKALNYPLPTSEADYGLDINKVGESPFSGKYLIFLHATTWQSKLWPENYWRQLAEYAGEAGYAVYLNSGNEEELARGQRIAQEFDHVTAMPRKSINELARIIAHAQGGVAVDTGLGHLAAALATPTVSLYGPTDAVLTGAHGKNQTHIQAEFSCSPCLKRQCDYPGEKQAEPACFAKVPAEMVWQQLKQTMEKTK